MPMSDADMIVDMQMSMSFNATFEHFLFKKWEADSTGAFLGYLVLIIVLSFLTEILSQYKGSLGKKAVFDSRYDEGDAINNQYNKVGQTDNANNLDDS